MVIICAWVAYILNLYDNFRHKSDQPWELTTAANRPKKIIIKDLNNMPFKKYYISIFIRHAVKYTHEHNDHMVFLELLDGVKIIVKIETC